LCGIIGSVPEAGRPERDALVDRLVRRGIVTVPRVEAALRSVPRHLFLPEVSIASAYSDEALVLKWDRGAAVSSISQPTMVASMLEMLAVDPGARVLEVGTGSGYNAALLQELAGQEGLVVSVEVDPQLADLARVQLQATGYESIQVHTADGRLGWPGAAPYDRIVVTASSPAPEPSWTDQLRVGGRMVVPLSKELRAVAFAKNEQGRLERLFSCPAVFIPLR
jgi:protein-L-isoaspartate(D-aspartate) O-methyltransferase